MKKLLTLFVIALTVVVSSCSKFDDTEIWDKLIEHENRITALEELCKQMNTNIYALQTIVEALEKNDYITNVSPVRKDGEVIGYTISFAYSDTITIYHGENGKDGADGKDGYTPQIGVMKDTDGIYYWTLDGEWLLDGTGNKIQANGINGTNGNNGQDGTDGVDGITPRLKIENDYWYVSYNDGITWVELGKSVSDNCLNNDNLFISVTQDDEYVYFNLADGTMITLPKHDKENIQFEDLQVKAICCKNWDTNNDGELSYTEAAAVTDIGEVFYANKNIIAFTELKHFVGLTEIASSAFEECTNLWKISIPESISTIKSRAFVSCNNLQYLHIPSTISSIQSFTFYDCGGQIFVDCNISSEAFYGNNFSSVVIGENVGIVGDSSFENSINLKEIFIPKNVTYIGKNAFDGCPNLESVVISDGVAVIDNEAFYRSDNLKTVVIGAGVVTIGEGAFQQSGKDSVLTSLYIKATTPPSLESNALYAYQYSNGNHIYSKPSNLTIYVPNGSVDAYKQKWNNYSDRIVGYDFNADPHNINE